MTLELLRNLLLWSAGINYLILTWWFLVFTYSHDWVYRLHGRWFALSEAHFDAIHYAGMSLYKIIIMVFNLVPGLILWWLSRAPAT